MRLTTRQREWILNRSLEVFPRLKHLNPYPFEGKAHMLYMSLWPRKMVAAVNTLASDKKYRNLVERSTSGSMYLVTARNEEGKPTAKVEIAFKFGKALPSADRWSEHPVVADDHPHFDALKAWVIRALEIDRDIKRCENFIRKLSKACKTTGHWYTAFPDFTLLLTEQMQEAIGKAKKRSPMPIELDENFLFEHRKFVGEKLATAMLLPEKEPKIWLG